MKLRRAPIEPRYPGQTLDHGGAIHFKLSIGKRIAGQRVHWEKWAKHLAVGLGVELAEPPQLLPHGVRCFPNACKLAASDSMASSPAESRGGDGRGGCSRGAFRDLPFQLGAISLQLMVCQIRNRILVRNLDLLRHERSEDAGLGRWIFVVDLFQARARPMTAATT
jgi:hypothetical protein